MSAHTVRPFLAIAAIVVAADQATKQLALSALADGPVDLVGSLRLRLTFNDGTAFSIGSGRTTLVSVIALGVSVVVLVAGLRAASRRLSTGYALVLGGAVGNLLDRGFRAGDGFLGGRVVDFVDLQWWPVFNVADVAIVTGVGVLVLLSWHHDDEDHGDAEELPAPAEVVRDHPGDEPPA